MKRNPLLSRLLLAGVLAAVLSCGDTTPVGPELPAPEAGLLGDLLTRTGLIQCRPMPTYSASEVIGPAGGSIRVGPHTLSIPPLALQERVRITAEAPSGRVNVVHFEPEGLAFLRDASLTMSYANCGLLGVLLPKRIAHTDDLLGILGYLLSVDNFRLQTVTGRLEHFSGYAVAW